MKVNFALDVEGKLISIGDESPEECCMEFEGLGMIENIYLDEVRAVLGVDPVYYLDVETTYDIMWVETDRGIKSDFHLITCRR